MANRSDLVIKFIEDHCFVPEGRDVGKPIRLRPFQKREIRKIYDNPHRTRRAILSFGRKNAKTTLAALLLLAHLCGPEARANSQLFSAAQSRDQAAILFGLAAKIVRLSPTLSQFVVVTDSAKKLICPELGTVYRALSADASTAHGLSPVFAVHDELGQVRGPRSMLYDAIETGAAAHEDPLSIIISTQAPTDADLLSTLIDDALTGSDPRVVVSLYTVPLEDKPFAIKSIKKANPAFGDFQNRNEVLAMANTAKRLPSAEASYRNLVLNQRVEAHSPFVSRSVWTSNGQDPEPVTDRPVWAGLDLSDCNDLTALVCIAASGTAWDVVPTFWLPAEGLAERSRSDRVPYDVWAREGYLDTTPGKSIEYEFVAHELRALFDKCDVQGVAFDRWGMRHLTPWLIQAGFTEAELAKFMPFGQGFKDMSPALRMLEGVMLNGNLRHGMHPVLTMCAANAVPQVDPANNRKLAKNKSTGRIDGMVALTMALGIATQQAEDQKPVPKYQMMFV